MPLSFKTLGKLLVLRAAPKFHTNLQKTLAWRTLAIRMPPEAHERAARTLRHLGEPGYKTYRTVDPKKWENPEISTGWRRSTPRPEEQGLALLTA
jgi:hypothetical protein